MYYLIMLILSSLLSFICLSQSAMYTYLEILSDMKWQAFRDKINMIAM